MIAPGEFQSAALATRAAGQPAYFSAWGLNAYYGQSYIVQDVSFNVHEGEIVALLGRNGAGKTSTLRSIARLAQPHLGHGEIWLDHQPLHEMRAFQAARVGVGLVLEERRRLPGLTGRGHHERRGAGDGKRWDGRGVQWGPRTNT